MATNGHDLSRPVWRKSTHSGSGNCLETAPFPSGIAVRDSANPHAPALTFTRRAWITFTAILKNDHSDRDRRPTKTGLILPSCTGGAHGASLIIYQRLRRTVTTLPGILTSTPEIARCSTMMNYLRAQALGPAESRVLITQVAEGMAD